MSRSVLSASIAVLVLPVLAAAAPIEEIVVSVQKRDQSQQDVPVAVSAYGEEFMDRLNVRDFRDVVNLSPGFNGKTDDSFNDALAIRGISSNSFGVGGDASVAIFVDGIYEGRNGGATTTFLDVERTEVVRGPQNTLFGRNAIAGAVSVTTNKPDTEAVSGNFGVGIEEYQHYDLTGTLNLPLSDRWALRGSVGYLTEDGYLTNLTGMGDLGDHESKAVQGAVRYAGDSIDATFGAFYEQRRGDGSAYWSTAGLNSNLELDFADQTSPLPKDAVANDLQGQDDADILRLTLNIDIDMSGGYTLNSITGFKTYDFNYKEDYDATGALVDHYSVDQEVDYFSQEFRLLSPSDQAVTWFVGASVYGETVSANFADRYTEDALCRALQITEGPDFDQTQRITGCDDPIFEDYWGEDIDPADLAVNKPESTFVDADSWGWAVYADATWAATDRLAVTLGARYTFDEKEYQTCAPDSGGALGNNLIYDFFYTAETAADCGRAFNGASPGGYLKDKNDWSGFTPRLALTFDATDEITLYGNVAWGYKTGGFGDFGFVDASGNPAESDPDTGLALVGTRPSKYDEEKVLSYEVGAKTRMFDNSLDVNLALYAYNYDDLQITFFSGGAQLTDNVAQASGYGAELELRWVPGENWDVFFSAAYSNTEIDEVDPGFLLLGGCDACAGNELPFAPHWSTGTVVTYSFPLANESSLFVTAQHTFYGEAYGGLDNLDLARTDSWNEVNLQIGYDTGRSWVATVYVNNLADEEYFERGWENADADNLFGYGNVNTKVWPAKPRSFGARFDYRF